MFDLRGAVVDDSDGGQGFAVVERPGYIHPEYLRLLPGVGPWDYGRTTRVPRNVLPSRTSAVPLEVPCCPRSGLVLREYQVEAVRFAQAADWCCVVAHDVGLGKTLIALMVRHLAAPRGPFLVVGPLIAAGAWTGLEADPAVHFGLKVEALRTRDPEAFTRKHLEALRVADGYFINFEILQAWQTQLSGYKLRTVIVDESHLLRSSKTEGARAFRALVRSPSVRARIALTATPLVNKVADLWSQLDFAQPRGFGRWTDFVVRYNGSHPTEFSQYTLGEETNVPELRARLARVLIRRSRFDARKELPAFERQLVALRVEDLDPQLMTRYRDLEEAFKETLQASGESLAPQGQALQQVNAMASILAEAKRPFAVQETASLLASQRAVVVFCWYKETAAHVAREITRSNAGTVFGPIDSTTTKPKRDRAADEFAVVARRGSLAAFVATVGCAGMSMNQLSCAPCALCCELYWVPATLLQMEGRIHREGQRASACFVRYLYVRGTIDELMLRHLQHKARIIERVSNDPGAGSLCEALGGAEPKGDFRALCEALLQGEDDAGERR